LHFNPLTLDNLFETFIELGKGLVASNKGRDLEHRTRAQVMDWCDNFYERMKNKKVTFLSSLKPLRLGGLWIPDMIRLASAHSHEPVAGQPARTIEWSEVVKYRPDVIIVAPEGVDLATTLKSFKEMERLPNWEDVPAVKRGEVIFTEGAANFHRISPRI